MLNWFSGMRTLEGKGGGFAAAAPCLRNSMLPLALAKFSAAWCGTGGGRQGCSRLLQQPMQPRMAASTKSRQEREADPASPEKAAQKQKKRRGGGGDLISKSRVSSRWDVLLYLTQVSPQESLAVQFLILVRWEHLSPRMMSTSWHCVKVPEGRLTQDSSWLTVPEAQSRVCWCCSLGAS